MTSRLSELPDGHPVAVDTETSNLYNDPSPVEPTCGGRISVVSYAFRDPDTNEIVAKAIPFDQGINDLPLGPKQLNSKHTKRIGRWEDWAREEVAPNQPPEVFTALVKELRRFHLVYQNAKFDMRHFRHGLRGSTFGYHRPGVGGFRRIEPGDGIDLEPAFYWDTMLASHVIDPRMPTGLKPTAVRLGLMDGDEDASEKALAPWLGPKTGKTADPRYDLAPWSVMEPYATQDAELTLRLFEHQVREMADDSADAHYGWMTADFELMLTLYRMENRGVYFNVPLAQRSAEILKKAKVEVAAKLPFKGSTGGPTPNSARKFFFEDAGRPPYPGKVTDGGQAQVDDEVIERLVKDGVEHADTYQLHESYKSALAKWYDAWPHFVGPDQALRTDYRQARVVSGRLSVSRVQLQAIPNDYQVPDLPGVVPVKQLFEPDEGFRLFELDVSQAEIRIAAAIANCVPMLEAIKNGENSHSVACRRMFEIDEDDPHWDEFRQVAKRCNLGILYGAGVRALQEQIAKFTGKQYSQNKVKGFIDAWRMAFPEFSDALDQDAQRAEQLGFIRLIDGRPRWFADHEPSHKAFNQRIQGSLAVTMNRIMCRLEDEYYDSLLHQVHDSVWMRFPVNPLVDTTEDKVKSAQDIMSEMFQAAFKYRVPFVVDVKEMKRHADKNA